MITPYSDNDNNNNNISWNGNDRPPLTSSGIKYLSELMQSTNPHLQMPWALSVLQLQ